MKVEKLIEIINSDFYTGVPDSQLRPLCNYLINVYGTVPEHHVIAANEGNCTSIAAGYHLATGKIPVVYMQNSGEGNIINPVASLLSDMVYAIPCIFIIGWRGEPGIHDEPQHAYQGRVTLKLLEDMEIRYYVIEKDTSDSEVKDVMEDYRKLLSKGKSVAFVVRRGALSYKEKVEYRNSNVMSREEAIRHIVEVSARDPIICTTGKASRELFEIRESKGQGHKYDFLTVGSMGHASSIALGVAINKPYAKIWCIDGDGALLMHMGAMAVIGAYRPENLIHIVINNEAHDTVGGMPTVSGKINIVAVAKACGYPYAVNVENFEKLDEELYKAKDRKGLSMIEIKCAIGARDDLGRPTVIAAENKKMFANYLNDLK